MRRGKDIPPILMGHNQCGYRYSLKPVADGLEELSVQAKSTRVELCAVAVKLPGAAGTGKTSLALQPYVWGVTIQPDELVELNAAEYAGKRLVGKNELHLARIAPPRGEQRILRQRRGGVFLPTDDPRLVSGEVGDTRPQRRRLRTGSAGPRRV